MKTWRGLIERVVMGLVAALPVVLMLSPTTPVAAYGETCDGRSATVTGNEGTEGDDVIISSGGTQDFDPVTVRGYGGNDTICVLADPENPGLTHVYAGDGNDWVYVEYGTNYVWGEGGNDYLEAFAEWDNYLNGGPGNDTYSGRAPEVVAVLEDVGSVKVNFATGIIKTEDGTDRLDLNPGVLGGSGNDVFYGTKARQFIHR